MKILLLLLFLPLLLLLLFLLLLLLPYSFFVYSSSFFFLLFHFDYDLIYNFIVPGAPSCVQSSYETVGRHISLSEIRYTVVARYLQTGSSYYVDCI